MQACIHGKGGDHSFKFKFFPKKERKHEEAYPKMETHVKLQKIKKPTSPTSNREKKVSMQKKEEEWRTMKNCSPNCEEGPRREDCINRGKEEVLAEL